jgi:flagellar basal body-associated protein FliL
MSDEKKDGPDAGDGKKDDKKAAAEAKPAGGGIKALLGPIAAVVVLLGAGIGLGMFLAKTFSQPPAAAAGAEAGAHGSEAHGDAAEGGEEHAEGASHGLLHGATEIVIEDIVANVKDQGGKRFAKVEPSIYVVSTAGASLGLEGGGHGGGEVGGPIKRILKARIEEHLKQYDLDELTSQAIYKRLEKNIRDIAEKEMKAFAPDLPANKPVVVKVVLSGLVVQ